MRAAFAFVAAVAFASIAAGCFDPTFREGIECGEGFACPPGFNCDFATNTCRSGGSNAGEDDAGIGTGGTLDAAAQGRADAGMGCMLFPQGGCPPGDACDLDPVDPSLGDTVCREVVLDGHEEDVCDAPELCDAGFICLTIAGSAEQSCRSFCNMDADCVPPGGRCFPINFGEPIPNASFCTANCDPVYPESACPFGWNCAFGELGGPGFTECVPGGPGVEGSFCEGFDDCSVAHVCVDNSCRYTCGVNSGLGCSQAPGTECQGLVQVGDEVYGYCY